MMKKLFRNAKEHSGALFMSACAIIFPIGNNNINWGTAVIIVIIAICATVVLHILDDTEAIFRSDLHMWLIAIWLSTGVIIGKYLP
jgi:hypothetical protein